MLDGGLSRLARRRQVAELAFKHLRFDVRLEKRYAILAILQYGAVDFQPIFIVAKNCSGNTPVASPNPAIAS